MSESSSPMHAKLTQLEKIIQLLRCKDTPGDHA